MATIKGTKANDTRDGTSSKDTINGLGGNDTLSGLGGADAINGNEGNDTLVGGFGADSLTGGAGADTFKYESFDESKAGSAFGIDTIKDFNAAVDVADLTELGTATLKSSYDATFTGLQAVFVYNASTNQTTLSYYEGSSTPVFQVRFTGNVSYSEAAFLGITNAPPPPVAPLISVADATASEGESLSFEVTRTGDLTNSSTVAYTLSDGTTGTVTFAAGDGSETIIVATTEDNVVGNGGSITVTLSNPTNATISDGTATGTINDDDAPTEGNDNLAGTSGDDTIDLLGGDDEYNGLAGNDTIDGGEGTDTLLGGAGDDRFIGNTTGGGVSGSSAYLGGEGTDTLDYSGSSVGILVPETLDPTTFSIARADGTGGLGVGREIERFIGSNLTDSLNFNGYGTPIAVEAGGGNDAVIGTAGNDTINGGTGNDTLRGGAGNDGLVGGDGSDTAVYSGNRADYTIGATNITDNVVGRDGSDNIQTIEFLLFADGTLNTSSGEFAPTGSIIGTTGNDTLNGTNDGDLIYGFQGNDTLNSGPGNDVLFGGTGFDVLLGGTGFDVLNGGAGGDFIFTNSQSSGADAIPDVIEYDLITDSTTSDRDEIFGFESASVSNPVTADIIDFSNIDADPFQSGDQAFTFVATGVHNGNTSQAQATITVSGSDRIISLYLADGNNVADAQIIVHGPVTEGDIIW